jgi:hypothetical protein
MDLHAKRFQTGVITKFTQTGTSGVGRLEIIQGDPVNKDEFIKQEAELHRYYTENGYGTSVKSEIFEQRARKDWLRNGETERPPVSVREGVSLPPGMTEEAIGNEQDLRDKPYAARELRSFGKLITPSDRQKLAQQCIDLAAKMNAEEERRKLQTSSKSWPTP